MSGATGATGETGENGGAVPGTSCSVDLGEARGEVPPEELGFDPAEPGKPVLVWDGTCGFCRRSLEHVRDRVGNELHYVPYQYVHQYYDDLDEADFQRAVHLIEPNGLSYAGAEAIFRALDHAPEPSWGRILYDAVPPFAAASEAGYRFVAEHRPLVSKVSRWLIGEDLRRTSYRWSRWLFLRLLAVVFLIAFASLGAQILGLIGSQGIAPAAEFVEGLHRAADRPNQSAGSLFWRAPTLFWWFEPTDGALTGVCTLGGVVSIGLFAGLWPRLLLPILWALYLSLCTVAGPFLGYQWDVLLLESAALGFLLAPAGFWTLRRAPRVDRAPVWVFQWLAFRLMFMSGLAKLLSGDPTWWDFTALTYHFWTQPLPTWTAYWVHHLPDVLLRAGTALALFVELIVPFLVFGTRRLKRWAAYAFIALQIAIFATGNYTYFNILTIGVCFMLVDDTVWRRLVPEGLADRVEEPEREGSFWARLRGWTVAVAVAGVVVATAVQMDRNFSDSSDPTPLGAPTFVVDAIEALAPFRTLNNYGLFANMTTSRPEIVVEGSIDGEQWEAYDFRWKPDDLEERPRFVQPHQPRLDWQLWFQALRLRDYYRSRGGCGPSKWFVQFQRRLLEGSEPVLELLERRPFDGKAPKYVRAVVYEYRFSEPGSGEAWWRRSQRREYCPILTLEDGDLVSVPRPGE